MIPTSKLEDRVRALIAADATQLADPAGMVVMLIAAPFTPGRGTDAGSLVAATFTGSAPKTPTAGAQASFMDPRNSENVVQLIAPAGGWNWKCTVAPAAPETIYGVAVCNLALTSTWASQLLPTPVTITNVDDAISIGDIRMGLPIGSWNDDPVEE